MMNIRKFIYGHPTISALTTGVIGFFAGRAIQKYNIEPIVIEIPRQRQEPQQDVQQAASSQHSR